MRPCEGLNVHLHAERFLGVRLTSAEKKDLVAFPRAL